MLRRHKDKNGVALVNSISPTADITAPSEPAAAKVSSKEVTAKVNRQLMSSLREGLRKLEAIHQQCDVDASGKTREQVSGYRADDAWRQAVFSVERLLKEAMSDAQARVVALGERGGQTEAIKLGHAVRKALSECVSELDRMKTQNEELLTTLNSTKAMRRSAKANKAADLATEESRLQTQYSIRIAEHAALTQRVEQAAASLRVDPAAKGKAKAAAAAAAGAGGRSVMGGVVRRPRLMDLELDGAGGAGGGRPTVIDMQEEEDPESLRLQAQIEQQGQELDSALDVIRAQVGRLKNQAIAMQDELTTQEAILDKVEEKITSADKQLKTLNNKLKKVQRAIRPQMCIMNTMCFIILLSVAGWIFLRFRDNFDL